VHHAPVHHAPVHNAPSHDVEELDEAVAAAEDAAANASATGSLSAPDSSDDETPAQHATPPVHHTTPPSHHATPPGHHATPPAHHATPPGNHAAAPQHHATPPPTHHTHPGQQVEAAKPYRAAHSHLANNMMPSQVAAEVGPSAWDANGSELGASAALVGMGAVIAIAIASFALAAKPRSPAPLQTTDEDPHGVPAMI